MIGSLPPLTDQQIIELLENQIKIINDLNEEKVDQLRLVIKEQKQLINELDEYIRDNI